MTDIKVDQFAILKGSPTTDDFTMRTHIQFGNTPKGNEILCALKIEFVGEADEVFMMLQTTCAFEILSEDWEKMHDEEKAVIPASLLQYFAMQSIGTARGILHCKTEGTAMAGVIIPSMNVTKIVDKNLTITKETKAEA